MKSIRVASGQGFWGDLPRAPIDQVTKGPIDYLMMDYLAEVTMSIMQRQKLANPSFGYAKDLIPLLEKILPVCLERNIKIITNGGGVNPEGCRDAILKVCSKLGLKGLRIGIILGDDILSQIPEFLARGIRFDNMESGESLDAVRERLVSANVYFGARPIVEALSQGAQVVISGRTTDTSLTYAPMIHEFGWKWDEWDKLAAGVVAGHILECGGQASGGNFGGNWRSIPDIARIGFPIAVAFQDGTVIVTKHENTGGRVSVDTISEQLLYEISDPTRYITPDCIADFTSIQLEEAGENRVKIHGVRGAAPTDSFKVSMSYQDGYSAIGSLTYAWPDAVEKAQKAEEILRTRLSDLNLTFDEIRAELVGLNSCHGPLAKVPDVVNEVMLRIGVRGKSYSDVESFGKELAPLILTGPPSVTGFAGGRPKPSDVIAYWPALMPKSEISPTVVVTES